uniref:P2X purinoceptor n=1 Tax=Crocodylus porosus TaxID=8502 RepID=A0A7M4EZT9_CROPO
TRFSGHVCQSNSIKAKEISVCKRGKILAGQIMMIHFALVTNRLYQEKESVISSVHTKVKGVSQAGSRIWDTAEYTVPMQVNTFFVITNIITTEEQTQHICPEVTGRLKPHMPIQQLLFPFCTGIQTGKCVQYNATIKTCQVSAWCPVESVKSPPVPALLKSAENFTVLIKNNIHFPKFNYTANNILPKFNITCTFNKITAPTCPIFRLGDILQATGENFSDMAVQGGIMGIEINWDCNLDKWFHHCSPKYSFRRLDDKTTKDYPGYNFRFAKYFKDATGKEERTLIKAYGIRFDILVFGTAGKFDLIELVVYIGSTLSYFGLAVFIIDFLTTSTIFPCCKSPVKEYYYRKKYETVPGPKATVIYVSYVDKPHVILVDKPLDKSLQHIKGQALEVRTSICVCGLGSRVLLPRKGQEASSSHKLPSWCCCGKCQQTEALWEQLCCRRKDGTCITASALFEQLVLSRSTLEFTLLYKEPLLDLNTETLNNQLRHCAYKQYIHWRFGSAELAGRALIPSCCRWKIREAYPSEDGKYSGFKKR